MSKLAEQRAEIAQLRVRLSELASMYSDAVDVFNTGFSGYEAVLLGQEQRRIFRSTGVMMTKAAVKALMERPAGQP